MTSSILFTIAHAVKSAIRLVTVNSAEINMRNPAQKLIDLWFPSRSVSLTLVVTVDEFSKTDSSVDNNKDMNTIELPYRCVM